jgi:hypothetical protein
LSYVINQKCDEVRLRWVEFWGDWEYQYHIYEDDVVTKEGLTHRKVTYIQGSQYPRSIYLLDEGVTTPTRREPKAMGIACELINGGKLSKDYDDSWIAVLGGGFFFLAVCVFMWLIL